MRNGVNSLITLIRSVVLCLNVVFTCFAKINGSGVFCIRAIFIIHLLSFFPMSSSLWIWQEKKTRLFWSGKFFIQDCLIPSNRSITVCAGTFLFGFLWLGFFYAYWSISQKSVKGVVIQALFIMGGNSKNSDEIREKSTRAILVTQAVNDLGYSILASVT
jgi:hypothetical protein